MPFTMRGRADTTAKKRAVIERILVAWLSSPSERLGQFLINRAGEQRRGTVGQAGIDLFNIEDEKLAEHLESGTLVRDRLEAEPELIRDIRRRLDEGYREHHTGQLLQSEYPKAASDIELLLELIPQPWRFFSERIERQGQPAESVSVPALPHVVLHSTPAVEPEPEKKMPTLSEYNEKRRLERERQEQEERDQRAADLAWLDEVEAKNLPLYQGSGNGNYEGVRRTARETIRTGSRHYSRRSVVCDHCRTEMVAISYDTTHRLSDRKCQCIGCGWSGRMAKW